MSEPEADGTPAAPGRNGPPWFLIGVVFVAVICAVFVFQNSDRTQVRFLFFEFNSRVWVAIAVAMALGILLDRLIIAWWRRSRKNRD